MVRSLGALLLSDAGAASLGRGHFWGHFEDNNPQYVQLVGILPICSSPFLTMEMRLTVINQCVRLCDSWAVWHFCGTWVMQLPISNTVSITVKYIYKRGNVIYFCCPVPKDLKDRVGATVVKQNLKTSDPIQAAKAVAKLNRELEAEWAALRGDPKASSSAALAQAVSLLRSHGIEIEDIPKLKAQHDEDNAPDFFDEKVCARFHGDAGSVEFMYDVGIQLLSPNAESYGNAPVVH